MKIFFGLELDDLTFPKSQSTEGGVHHFGPQGLTFMLESHLGLIGHPPNNEHLRIEQYRQALHLHLHEYENSFYKISFEADQLATAATLLSMRDELLLAGWDFQNNNQLPKRLQTIFEVENIFKNSEIQLELSWGFADRFIKILNTLNTRDQPIETIYLNEPPSYLPTHFQFLFQKLKKLGVSIHKSKDKILTEESDLYFFQKTLKKEGDFQKKLHLKNDGSLLLVKSKRETDAASWLAKFFQKNKKFHPLCLIPEKNRALDNALLQEGLPSLGILSASLARPSLQILKLVSTFLWQPIDPYKILEFVTLSVKPLHDELASQIAMQIAQTPGVNSESWYAMVNRFFAVIEDRAQDDATLDAKEIRAQYQFWFERRRYNVNETVPKKDAIEIFEYLRKWASKEFENSGEKNTSMIVLSEQGRRVKDLLEALPENETQLSHLQLERIVRTIYEPSPVVFQETELKHLPYIHQSSAILKNVTELLWWNFASNEPDYFFSRWYQNELAFLKEKNIHLQSPEDKNRLLIWQRSRPIFQTQKQLILVMPKMVDGSEVFAHPLHDVLEATFENLEIITFDIDTEIGKNNFQKHFQIPQKMELLATSLGKSQPFIFIDTPEKLQPDYSEESTRGYETFTSLDAFFYYPYQWVFRHKIQLRKSSILSIVEDVTLKGNLSHRFFEVLFQQDIYKMSKSQVEHWIDEKAPQLFAREGAVLLMYGRAPERISFLNKIKYAAWSLVSMIQKNGWRVVETEMNLEGKFLKVPMKAKADLVLEKGNEKLVIDLKWRGASRRKNVIKNEEDLQLVMYSRLLTEDRSWAHTAYFILESGKMIARNSLAINEVEAVAPDSDHIEINQRIWDRMESTYRWRLAQIQKGQIEVRTKHTQPDLEEHYAGQMMDLLEMPDKGAFFDDYRTLIDVLE